MKIAVISSQVFAVGGSGGLPGYGGLEVIAWQSAKGLAAKGHNVSVIAPDGSTCPGCEIIPTGPPGQWDEKAAYSKYWPELLKQDVICDHSWNKWSYLLKGEGRLKAPVLGVMHAPVATMYATLPPNVDNPCFVCISKDQAAHFEALHSREARVCYNGFDTQFYRALDVPRTQRYLFLARFSTIKGPHLALEACKHTGAQLDLVGDHQITNEPEYLKQCQAMCDGRQLKMVGGVTRGETVWWYSQSKALLHPNKLYREPFGLAPVEAMACGTPCIAWKYGAMKETILHGETGFLVNSLEEMENLIRTNAVDNIDRNRCWEWAMCFSLEKMVNRYEELCHGALGGGW